MAKRTQNRRLLSDRRGIAAAEFALIAPALIFLMMGVLEMSFRFRAKEEATRYAHQMADLISREKLLTTATLSDLYNASVNMMKPLDTTDRLDFDVASIGYDSDGEPEVLWRRVAGEPVPLNIADAEELGVPAESVIRVAVRYRYTSPLSDMFGGATMSIVQQSFARPRSTRLLPINSVMDDGGAITYFVD